MEATKKEVYKKAVKVISNVSDYMKENDCKAQVAWNVVREASNLTEDQMVQCAIVAIRGKKYAGN